MGKMAIVSEFYLFLKTQKKWWLLPVVVFLVLIGFVVIVSESAAIAPFIYTLF